MGPLDETGSSTNSLDDVDLLGTEALEYNGELGLLLCGAGSGCRSSSGKRTGISD